MMGACVIRPNKKTQSFQGCHSATSTIHQSASVKKEYCVIVFSELGSIATGSIAHRDRHARPIAHRNLETQTTTISLKLVSAAWACISWQSDLHCFWLRLLHWIGLLVVWLVCGRLVGGRLVCGRLVCGLWLVLQTLVIHLHVLLLLRHPGKRLV